MKLKVRNTAMLIRNTFTRLRNWVTKSWRNAVFSIVIFIGSIVLFKLIILPIAGGCLIVCFLFSDEISAWLSKPKAIPFSTLENNAVCWEVTQFFYKALSQTTEILNEFCYLPKTANDLYDPKAFLSAYNNAPLLNLRLLAKNKEISSEDLKFLKPALQSVADARVLDGELIGYLWAVPLTNTTPLLKIAMVEKTGLYLHIGVLLTNTPASVQAAQLSDKPMPLLTADDKDPLFKGGD